MGSLAKNYVLEKLFGRVYTPKFIARKMLDDMGYNSAAILGKKIIDPACGDGRFLIEIAKRIINFSPKEKLKENLERIYGWDIDETAIEKCIKNLNDLIDNNLDIKWNISVTDSIKKYKKNELSPDIKDNDKFDVVVGNPPYIRIQHLSSDNRAFIQANYSFCQSGSTDIFIAFFELSLNLLSNNGIAALITPNSFLYTETAMNLRKHFLKHKNLLQITNYGDIQLFEGRSTYSAIAIFNKKQNEYFKYQKAIAKDIFEEAAIDFSQLSETFWQLSTDNKLAVKGKKLKDICDIHAGLTTLCDRAYIFNIEIIDDKIAFANTKLRGKIKIERDILKPIVKGSKLKNSAQEISEYILFPYKKIDGKHTIIPEDEFKENFPLAYQYLFSVKAELDKRDNGAKNPVAWYAFGRSQGLRTSFGAKIIFSPINNKPNFVYYADPECTFYSGYCIKYNGDPRKLLEQLNSKRMEEFAAVSSRDFRGGWKAYNKKIIENYEVAL
ncbi:MAG: N-6 DNA methylase [Helicobacteraceae bacterium]|jgi:type I restriction-modification system DNA methylase subunit|nr:N-6 DNA methylase [Helicobacteraceae bacterium]